LEPDCNLSRSSHLLCAQKAIITNAENAHLALKDEAGTRIVGRD